MENNVVEVTQKSGVIKCDFESAKAYLRERLEEYKGITFTEDSKAAAKGTIASLRKEKKAFQDRVKEVKAEYMAPFEKFWEQAAELIEMYDEPIGFINSQVEEFEKKRIEEKKQLIIQLYEECISDMQDFLPLEKLYNPKWENATTTQKAIREELMTRKETAKSAIAVIKGMNSEVEELALNMYKETFDLTKSILYINQNEKQKAEILAREQERIRREEEERIRREEREKMEAERRAQEEKEAALRKVEEEKEAALRKAEEEKQQAVEVAKAEAAQEVIDSLIPDTCGKTNLYEYRISLSANQKEKLEMYLDSVGIDWELI